MEVASGRLEIENIWGHKKLPASGKFENGFVYISVKQFDVLTIDNNGYKIYTHIKYLRGK
ncbi:hypothetical protein ES708_28640 [subsurface metagenome]